MTKNKQTRNEEPKANFARAEKFKDAQKQARFEAEAEIFRGLLTADELYQERGSAAWQLWR